MSDYKDLVAELNEIEDIIPMSKKKLTSFYINRDCEYYDFGKSCPSAYGAYCKYNEKWFGSELANCAKCELL